MKGGTTALWHYLSHHPEVFVSVPKELDFFIAERNWNRGEDWYESHFETGKRFKAVGEASPNYTKHPLYSGVPERMAATIPGCRLIYVIRDPIERMRSEYLHQIADRREPAFRDGKIVPIESALHPFSQYVDNSRYWMQIQQFLAHFDRERLLVITSEELLSDRRSTLRRVLDFLEVDPDWYSPILEEEFHRTERKRKIRGGLVDPMRRIYKRFDEKLPAELRRVAIRAGTAEVRTSLGEITEPHRKGLEDAVRDDVIALREFLGPTFAGWGIIPSPSSDDRR